MSLMLKEFIMMASVTIDMIKWPWVIAEMDFIDKNPGLSILVPILNKEWNSDWLLGTTNCLLDCSQRHCKYTGGSIWIEYQCRPLYMKQASESTAHTSTGGDANWSFSVKQISSLTSLSNGLSIKKHSGKE